MPPPAPVGSFARVTLVGRYQGQTTENTIVYKAQSAAGLADVAPFHTAAVAYWEVVTANMATTLVDTFSWSRIWSQIFTPTTTYVKQDSPNGFAGLTAAAGLPSEVALVTKKLSDFGDKENRGRNFWAGLPASTVTSSTGLWNSGSLTGFLTEIFAAYIHQITTVSPTRIWDPVITDGYLQHSALIVGGGMNTAPRMQRRRQIGVGI